MINFNSFGQFWTEEDENWLYKKEYVYGINFNTNGGLIGGFTFKYARVINEKMYHSFSVEAVEIKHPKENSVNSFLSGNSFVLKKLNSFYVVRPQYGREIVLFKKAKEKGVQVNWINSIGPAIGILAPYHIQYQYQDNSVKTEPYDPAIHTDLNSIVGRGSFFDGLSKASLEFGGSFKSSVSFEFGTFKKNVTGFEAGFMLDVFANEIPIMYEAQNKSVYTSVFLTIFFGSRK